jgi:protein TonB
MAFEAYLQQGTVRPSRGRRITYTVSVAVHAAAVLAAIAYSFWHVEELNAPVVTVTFVSAAVPPPAPAPPPALGGGAAPKRKAVARPRVEIPVKAPDVVQPKADPVVEPPREAPKEVATEAPKDEGATRDTGASAGVGKTAGAAGGVANGVKGGTPGGTGSTPGAAPKFLPPLMGAKQRISGAEPEFPTNLRTAGARYLVVAKICVGPSGAVDTVTLLKRAHPTLDNNVVSTVKTWRYRPLTANGTPVPFCYFLNHQFESE